MNRVRFSRTTARTKPTAPFLSAPPSGALINAVVQHADLIKDLGDHRSLMRLSEKRRRDPRVRNPLGREAKRLGDVAVIWDDEEDQLVRVLDAAAGHVIDAAETMTPFGDSEVALTSDALAYLQNSQPLFH